jgi:hypothetical protein
MRQRRGLPGPIDLRQQGALVIALRVANVNSIHQPGPRTVGYQHDAHNQADLLS